jgi:hypothetical protein
MVFAAAPAIPKTPPPATIPKNSPVLPFAVPRRLANSCLISGENCNIYSNQLSLFLPIAKEYGILPDGFFNQG